MRAEPGRCQVAELPDLPSAVLGQGRRDKGLSGEQLARPEHGRMKIYYFKII